MKGAPPPQKAPGPRPGWPGARQLLLGLLILALVRGLLYLALMPPWQHYDEPTHFEYVRLIAERKALPQPGDYVLEMRREIAASMQAHGFWQGAPQPLHLWSETPPEIGVSELDHPPLYYLLLALPQLLVMHQSVETQLYAARLGSVLLYLLTVAAAYGLTAELFPRRRSLPLAVAALVSLLPPFADLGSSVNNDVGVAAVTSLLLWSAVRLLRRGPSPARVGATLLLAGASLITKSTSGPIALALLVALAAHYILAWAGPARRRWIWPALLLALPALLLASLTWNRQAAHWYGAPPTARNAVAQADVGLETPQGSRMLALSREGGSFSHSTFQELGRDTGRALQGQTVTFGAWLRSGEGGAGRAGLGIFDGAEWQWHSVQITPEWRFYAFGTGILPDAPGVGVQIRLPGLEDGARTLYADGLVLAAGEMPRDQPPSFADNAVGEGRWGGQAFVNLLQNGSAEQRWPALRPWLGEREIYRTSLAQIWNSVWDWRRTSWVYGGELQRLFQTFWGILAWGHLSLPGAYFYLLAALSALAVAGLVLGLVSEIRSPRTLEWQRWAWGLLGLALLLTWSGTVLRVHPVFLTSVSISWPVARYASGVIAPMALLLCLGLANLVPRRWVGIAAYAGLLGMATLEVVAVWTVILPYYYG